MCIIFDNIQYDDLLVLKNGNLIFDYGKTTVISGESGREKTSLLYRLVHISESRDFEYYLLGKDINKLSNTEQSLIRKDYITFITQDNMLFEHYDVLGNLKIYSQINNRKYSEKEYQDILHIVDLNIPFHQSIDTLSGGQKQRLAIVCAMCKDTQLLF